MDETSTPADDAGDIEPQTDVISAAEDGMDERDQNPVDPLDAIDDDDLANYILELLRNDVRQREQSGWTALREYDINAYEGNRKPTNFPWVNCSNFPVPLTLTLVDTAHANIMGSIFSDTENTTDVQGVGQEDIRSAPLVGGLINWQINSEINAYEEWDKFVFRSFLHGTGILKVMQSIEDKILVKSIAVENVYLPIDAEGFQVGETDHVIELISLTYNDVQERKLMKNPKTGKPFYEGIEEIQPGLKFGSGNTLDATTRLKDAISGTKLYDRQMKDLRYILEVFVTYYPPSSDSESANDPIELIVTMSTNGRKILRKEINQTGKRPYVKGCPYPRDDRFYGRSLPEKIRPIQEEVDYAHNQNINAADIVISPPTFYDPVSGFNPNEHEIVPGGAYPSLDGKAPQRDERNLNPVFERQEDRYWDLAERATGLTELFQGRAPSRTKTLGEAKLRNNRTEIRFKALYQRFEKAWSDMVSLIYFYDSIWMKPEKEIKVVGVGDYKSVKELFPDGLNGNYNFTFHNAPLTEIELRNERTKEMCMEFLQMPMVASSPGNTWRVMKKYSEVMGEKNLEVLVTKPKEANILSPEEIIQRVMSGQYEIIPEPGMDYNNCLLRLQLFFLTDSFKSAKPEAKQALLKILERVKSMAVGELKAKVHARIINQGDPTEQLMNAQNGGENGNLGGTGNLAEAQGQPGLGVPQRRAA